MCARFRRSPGAQRVTRCHRCARRPHPRRVRVAERVYQRVDRDTGKLSLGSTSSPTATRPGVKSGRPRKARPRPTPGPSAPSCSRACTEASASSARPSRCPRSRSSGSNGRADRRGSGHPRRASATSGSSASSRRLGRCAHPAYRKLQAARPEHGSGRGVVTCERVNARANNRPHRPDRAQPGLPLRRPSRLARRERGCEARTR